MIRKISALFVALAIGAAVAPTPLLAEDGIATFNFTNSSSYTVYLRMYSKSRAWTWPSATQAWILNNNAPHSFPLSCEVGEKICFGAFWNNGRYWGVGQSGNEGCQGCCLTCGTFEENPSHGWNLLD